MTVRSLSSGSAKGLSLIRLTAVCRSSADRPQFQPQIGEFARDVDREAARGLHLLPVRAVAVQLEIGGPGIERQLPRRHRQRPHRDARQGDVDQFADLVSRYVWIHVGRCRLIHNPCANELSARNHTALFSVELTSHARFGSKADTYAVKKACPLFANRGHRPKKDQPHVAVSAKFDLVF